MTTFLLLHGGAGPASVAAFAERLSRDAHVIAPTHPGFGGTPRDGVETIRDYAVGYAKLVEDFDDVTVVGNSIGGWIAAELALLDPHQVRRYVLVDAVGIEVPGHPVVDFFSLTLPEVAKRSYYDPERFRIEPGPDAQSNRETLAAVAGGMADPTLRERLAGVSKPTLVVWGDSDGIVDPDYGRAYADAIPGARFALLENTGHLPQIESPDALLALV
ncbi:alpha/beta fold hydrolase [Solirubrobacter soli]|uniref:alpha/beta fold hydrolase n=1 Tax=Solirubrobacter soli TaxID=363832 RepID=UPI00042279DB|nr:alpha/beta hydrolase [Solirubrobacter soli]